MTLPILNPPTTSPLRIILEPLTPESFSPFGTVITSPLPSTLHNVPSSIPPPLHPTTQPTPIFANQNSAIKTSPISPLTNNYPSTPPSRPQMSMFSCFPRQLSSSTDSGPKFQVKILERHPYTTQTFSPLGLSPTDTSTCFLVIVAPTLSSTRSSGVSNPPDLSRVRAFLARGNQAVTYAPGTWHAPMVVLGRQRVDFVVTQFVNGVADDDCQEVLVGGDVSVDLGTLRLGEDGVAKAKL